MKQGVSVALPWPQADRPRDYPVSFMFNRASGHIPTSDRTQGSPCPVVSHRYRDLEQWPLELGEGTPGVGTAVAGRVRSGEGLRPVGEEERAGGGYVREAAAPSRGDFCGAVFHTQSGTRASRSTTFIRLC